MIDKVSGGTTSAVMSFGGFLGLGDRRHPLPWSTLKSDTQKGGDLVNLDKAKLEAAPQYGDDSQFKWTPEYGRKVDSCYNAPSFWA